MIKEEEKLRPEGRVAVVNSAFGGVTDQLVLVAHRAAAGDASYTDTVKECIHERHENAAKELVQQVDAQKRVLEKV